MERATGNNGAHQRRMHDKSYHQCPSKNIQQQESFKDTGIKEIEYQFNRFRQCEGKGLWLPAMLPLACVVACFLQHITFDDSGPAVIFAIQSLGLSYYTHQKRKLNKQELGTPAGSIKHTSSKDEVNKLLDQPSSSSLPMNDNPMTWILVCCNLMATLALYFCAGTGLLMSVLISLFTTGVHSVVSDWLVTCHSLTFSEGEWLLSAQCVAVCVATSLYHLCQQTCHPAHSLVTCQTNTFIQLAVLLSSLLALLLLCLHPPWRSHPLPAVLLTGILGVAGFTWGSLLMGELIPVWLWQLVTHSTSRLLLLCWWILCCAGSVLATLAADRYTRLSVSVLRKVHHLVCVAVYTAGVVVDAPLLRLATIAATAAVCLLEVLRLLGVPPLAELLTKSYTCFLDEKDRAGELVLSHVYLLVGLSLPLWILGATVQHPTSGSCEPYGTPPAFRTHDSSDTLFDQHDHEYWSGSDEYIGEDSFIRGAPVKRGICYYNGFDKRVLLLLSGVISVGIGDTFASVCGIIFGKTRWPGTKKTVLGTVSGIMAQLVMVLLLYCHGTLTVPTETYYWCGWWTGVVATVVASSIVEAFTDQVDNIVLPLLMFIGFGITECFTL